MKYLLFDFSNLAHRIFHIVTERDLETRRNQIMCGIAYSINDIYAKFAGIQNEDVKSVFIFDSNSWRKKVFESYKANRAQAYKDDLEGQELMYNIINDYREFIETTNAYCLKYPDAECDDLTALFIEQHPNDEHIIISTDTDFYQLISNNVSLYSPVSKNTVMFDKVVDSEGTVIPFTLDGNGKIKIGKDDGIPVSDISDYGSWQEWCLYCKIVRGDAGDNVFPAYPGVRVKGSKNRVGILESFKERKTKGFNYVNFVNQSWEDHEGNKRLVEECMEFNRRMIDLRYIDNDYREKFLRYINDYESSFVQKSGIGITVGRFAGKFNLVNVISDLTSYTGAFK